MKVFIMTDLEGVSCAGNERLWNRANPEYADACERLTADLNAAIRACFDAGANSVSIHDGHGGGGNFDNSKLDPRAVYVPDYGPQVWDGTTALVQIGLHAKAGTQDAFLDHTQSSVNWFDYSIGGVSYGEIAQDALYAGAYGVPCVAISGDKAACDEAASLIPGIECAAVKVGTGRYSAECLPAEKAEELIYQAVLRGVKKAKEIKPFTIPLPAEMRLTYTYTHVCDQTMTWSKSVTRVGGRTVVKTVNEIRSFYDLLP